MGKPVAAALNPTLSAPISFVQLPKYPIVACFSSLCKCDWCKKIKYLASYLETQNFILIISSGGGGGREGGRKEAAVWEYVEEHPGAGTHLRRRIHLSLASCHSTPSCWGDGRGKRN